jgi:hypothetical protein
MKLLASPRIVKAMDVIFARSMLWPEIARANSAFGSVGSNVAGRTSASAVSYTIRSSRSAPAAAAFR